MSLAPKVEQAQATQTGHVMLSRSKTEEPFAVRHSPPQQALLEQQRATFVSAYHMTATP